MRTEAPRTHAPHWNLNPHVAAKDPARRVALIQRLVQFRNEYRLAWEAWRKAGKEAYRIVFPYGTYQLRLLAGVRCRSSG